MKMVTKPRPMIKLHLDGEKSVLVDVSTFRDDKTWREMIAAQTGTPLCLGINALMCWDVEAVFE